jgi:hypothetical protein
MKTLLVCCTVLFGSTFLHAQKTRPGQEPSTYATPGVTYPVSLHVYGLHLKGYCNLNHHCAGDLLADVTSNGRKLELWCQSAIPKRRAMTLSLGDFQARILGGASGSDFGDGYELLLPDKPKNRVIQCSVSGMME